MATADFDNIEAVMRAIHDGTILGVREATKQVASDGSGWAPVDTSFLRESVYYVTSDLSTYSQAVGKAQSIDAFRKVLPEVDAPLSDTEGVAAVAASYGLPVELGTSRSGAQPYMTPAAEAMRGKLGDIVADSINKAIRSAAK